MDHSGAVLSLPNRQQGGAASLLEYLDTLLAGYTRLAATAAGGELPTTPDQPAVKEHHET